MNRLTRITLTAAAFSALLAPTAAQALPTVSFTAVAQQTAGVAYTYDATNTVCDGGCKYEWRYYRTTGTDRLGTTMLTTYSPVMSFRIPEASGTYRVTLKAISLLKPYGWTQNSAVVTLTPPVLP
jgi:hypothetical protein